MPNVPSRSESGNLICPRCGTVLVRAIAPFVLHGEYVGRFEAIVCEICSYSALTAKGYDLAMSVARSLALVGAPEGEEPELKTCAPMYIEIRSGSLELIAEKKANSENRAQDEILQEQFIQAGEGKSLRIAQDFKHSTNDLQ
jgi:hypothetical protein